MSKADLLAMFVATEQLVHWARDRQLSCLARLGLLAGVPEAP
jgi:hypothetical protein